MLAEDSKFEGGSAQNAGMVVWSIFDGLGEPWARAHVEVLRGQNNSRVEEGRQYWKQEGLEAEESIKLPLFCRTKRTSEPKNLSNNRR